MVTELSRASYSPLGTFEVLFQTNGWARHQHIRRCFMLLQSPCAQALASTALSYKMVCDGPQHFAKYVSEQ